jgi:hypothetical protein
MLQPSFHYLNHENGKTVTSYFSQTYFNAVGAKTLFCEVIVPTEEINVTVSAKPIPFAEIKKRVIVGVSIKEILTRKYGV